MGEATGSGINFVAARVAATAAHEAETDTQRERSPRQQRWRRTSRVADHKGGHEIMTGRLGPKEHSESGELRAQIRWSTPERASSNQGHGRRQMQSDPFFR